MEVIIVIMIISLFAGLIIPRVAGISRGTGQLTVMQASDLLAAFAYRDSIASGKTALEYDGNSRMLALMASRRLGTMDDREGWVIDSLAPALYLPDGIEINAYLDEGLLTDGGWWIEANTDGTRPKIELELEGNELDSSVVLPAWAQSPYTMDRIKDSTSEVLLPKEIDLDSSGQERIQW
jgi:type II secretory pathway pseudopilin PulG